MTRGPVGLSAEVRRAELVSPTLRSFALEAPPVVLNAADLKVGHDVASQVERPGEIEVTSMVLGRLRFGAVVGEVAPLLKPRLHKNLEAAKRQPVRRRSVPVRFLSSAQTAHWQERLGNSKRVAPKHVAIVALFPNVALGANSPVQFLPEEAALAYQLPPKPEPLSTVVVAKHAVTGELLLGRFAQD